MKSINLALIAFLVINVSSCGTSDTQRTTTGSAKKPSIDNDSDDASKDESNNDDSVDVIVNDGNSNNTPSTPASPTPNKWRTVLLTGDSSINAFDNAREKIGSMILSAGVPASDMRNMSMSNSKINNTTVKKTSVAQLEASLQGLGANEKCFIHMTSHGSQTGFSLVNLNSEINATQLDGILTRTCGDRPTVLLISACYSGQFTASSAMKKANRVILTAARPDRTSFGCGSEETYTYWDSCLIESMPKVSNWQTLYSTTTACVQRKESGGFTPSEPQVFIGNSAQSIPYILSK